MKILKKIEEIVSVQGRCTEKYFTLLPFFSLFSSLLLSSCASVGSGPTGGEVDISPPVFVKSNPQPNAVRYDKNKIELTFDEYISIEKPSEKVIITPPQQKMPEIKALGKKITVELKDSLIANSTYTFDFTNGIVDNNEKNALEGFAFAFSTGDIIDSLMVSGILLNAENLEPMPNTVIGLHDNLNDTAFTSLPFKRTSMTNDRGQFKIRNVAPGTYKLYALSDMNRNYRFDQPNEAIAFHDSLIVPSFEPAIRMDTVRIDSLTIDTIKEVRYTRFTPDDLVLYLFNEKYSNQYLSKTERPNARQLVFHFGSDDGLPPTLRLFDDEPVDNVDNPENDWFIREYSPDKKDITYWITDSMVYKRDTIMLEADYLKSDSLMNLIPAADTLRFILRNKETPKKKDKKNDDEALEFLKVEINAKTLMEVTDTVRITFSEPLVDFGGKKKVQISQLVDSLWEDRDFPIVRDTLNPRVYYIDKLWPYGQTYRIHIDSAAIFSIYGLWNDSIDTQFKFNKEEDYGVLYVKISGNERTGFGELLDASDKVVRKAILKEDELAFEDLKPGKYYLRYIEDLNGNGVWDPGNYSQGLQPEKVYYYETFIDIRKYDEIEEPWNIKQIPVEKQKPLDITKNKPVAKETKRDRQNQQNQRQNNSNRPTMPNSNTRTLQQNATLSR
jgi:uncharacterized protein (DUF2141 family)